MKKTSILFMMTAWFACFSAFATPLDDIQKQVKEAMCNGNVQKIALLLDNDVEVSILESKKSKMKKQAMPLIQNYVNSNRPSNFIITHKTEKPQTGYLIGKLQTSTGQHQIHIMLKKGASNNFMIYQLRIEKGND